MAHSYNIDTGAWVQDTLEGWVSSKVVEKKVNGTKVSLVFELTGGSRTGEVSALFPLMHRSMIVAAGKKLTLLASM